MFNKDNYDKVKNIEHVKYLESNKYATSSHFIVDEFNSNNIYGQIDIIALIDKDSITTNINTLEMKDNEVICPKKFYPHELYINRKMQIIDSLYINGDNLIGTSFNVKSKNNDNLDEIVNLKVIGTYDNKQFSSSNTCYVTKTGYDKIASQYSHASSSEYENGKIETEYFGYDDLYVIVDDNKNIDDVKNALSELNISYNDLVTIDKQSMNIFSLIPLFIFLIVMIISLNVIYNFMIKKCQYNLKSYGILKTSGFTNKDINRISFIENVVVAIISTILAFILYLLLYNFIVNKLLVELVYSNNSIPIPYFLILVTLIIIIIIILIANNYINKKALKNSIQKLLEG